MFRYIKKLKASLLCYKSSETVWLPFKKKRRGGNQARLPLLAPNNALLYPKVFPFLCPLKYLEAMYSSSPALEYFPLIFFKCVTGCPEEASSRFMLSKRQFANSASVYLVSFQSGNRHTLNQLKLKWRTGLFSVSPFYFSFSGSTAKLSTWTPHIVVVTQSSQYQGSACL